MLVLFSKAVSQKSLCNGVSFLSSIYFFLHLNGLKLNRCCCCCNFLPLFHLSVVAMGSFRERKKEGVVETAVAACTVAVASCPYNSVQHLM